MSSGFVSGGTSEQPRERNELWQKAEQEVEAARQRKLEQKNHDGKSLYEVLQENKAAKQEAFEESIKLKHQFRSLDEDDVSFLNSIRETEDAKERAVQQETLNQLSAFRKQQEGRAEDDDVGTATIVATKNEEAAAAWQVTAKKRKHEHGTGLKGVKVAKRSKGPGDEAEMKANKADRGTTHSKRRGKEPGDTVRSNSASLPKDQEVVIAAETKIETAGVPAATTAQPVSSLGLTSYSSDDE